jgi:malonyl CoA-acyl carrier protein transacylase
MQTVLVYRVSCRGAVLLQAAGGRDAAVRALDLVETEQATYAFLGLSTGYLSVMALAVPAE